MYGHYLKAARESAGLSQAEMAAAIGYKGADMIYKIERNASEPSWEQTDKWATACGKLIGDILPNSGTSAIDDSLQPLLAAMAGMSREDMTEQILILASQARLNRNSILRHRNVTQVEGSKRPFSDTPSSPVGGNLQTFGSGAVEKAKPTDAQPSRRPTSTPAPGPFGTQAPTAATPVSYTPKPRKVR